MSMCASVHVFLNITSKCLLRFTCWDQVTKDAKKEAAEYILMYALCIRLNKQSVEWISLLSTEQNVPYYPFLLCCKTLWPSQPFLLLYNLNGSLCISQAWFPSCQAAISSLGSFPCDQPAQYILIHQYNQYGSQCTADPMAWLWSNI